MWKALPGRALFSPERFFPADRSAWRISSRFRGPLSQDVKEKIQRVDPHHFGQQKPRTADQVNEVRKAFFFPLIEPDLRD